jgi:hypothetical protein
LCHYNPRLPKNAGRLAGLVQLLRLGGEILMQREHWKDLMDNIAQMNILTIKR